MNLEECFSQIDSCEFECEGGPLRLNVGYIQLKSNTAKLEQQLAELKTECDKLVDRDSAIIWLRAERDHRRQERDKAQQQLADLKQQLAALREAAQTVVDSQMNARMTQSTHWKDVTVDALAALLQGEKG